MRWPPDHLAERRFLLDHRDEVEVFQAGGLPSATSKRMRIFEVAASGVRRRTNVGAGLGSHAMQFGRTVIDVVDGPGEDLFLDVAAQWARKTA